MINKRLSNYLSIFALVCAASGVNAQTNAAAKKVFVTAIVEHPALDAVRDGVRDELKARGFEPNKNLRFDYQSAQGNAGTAAQIARQFVGENPDVIVAVSTASAQSVASATKKVPVVFSAITDPVGAKLVSGQGASGTNITGLSDAAPVSDHLSLVAELMPKANRIGVVYSPGEANSVSIVNVLKEDTKKRGWVLVESAAPRSSDVPAAVRALAGKVDIIYVPQDNAVANAMDAVVSIAAQAKLPVFAADEASVNKGALATIGFDYYQLGRQTGVMVAQILAGTAPGAISWKVGVGTDTVVNAATAAKLGITIPDSVQRRAKVVGK